MAAGIAGVDVGAHHVGTGTSPWPLVPGLVVAGAGLALLVIPLVNVVLAAAPAEAAGGASGLFNTAQQIGGAVGIAVIGTVFFGSLGNHPLVTAFTHTAPYAAGPSWCVPRSPWCSRRPRSPTTTAECGPETPPGPPLA